MENNMFWATRKRVCYPRIAARVASRVVVGSCAEERAPIDCIVSGRRRRRLSLTTLLLIADTIIIIQNIASYFILSQFDENGIKKFKTFTDKNTNNNNV